MTAKLVLTLVCFLASLLAGADTLDIYGNLTGKTVLMPSGMPRLPDSIVADLPTDKTNHKIRLGNISERAMPR